MSKHIKELMYIIIAVSPLLIMSLVSNVIETPSEVSYDGLDRQFLLFSNSLFLLFFLVPYFVIRNKKEYSMNLSIIRGYPTFLLVLTTILFIVLNAPIIEWNKSISFPGFLSSFESWALLKEKQLESLTEYLISFESNYEFLVGILTIAIIPGLCEEYFFRGVLQKNLQLILKNPHIAILISAFLFSAFHLQFYGFFPRFFLGLLFGYFFYWSNSLIYPVIAHALNNFLSLSTYYFAKKGLFGDSINFSVNSSPDIPIVLILFSFVVFLYLIISLKKQLNLFNE